MDIKKDNSTETSKESVLGSESIEAEKIPKPKTTEKNIPPPRFTKEQLVHSSKYRDNSDLLNALLEEGQSYTKEEINSMIQAFHEKGGV